VLSGVIVQEEELVLSNYPKLFEKDVVIVIGENATQMEYESAEAIAANLENLTGNKPKIYISEKTESLKYTYNLIILGTPNSNEVLKEVYKMANVTGVTDEYPGEGKGVLEILKNPWDEDKAMLLVAGSDEWGVKAGSEKIVKKGDALQGKTIITEWIKGLVLTENETYTWTWGSGEQNIVPGTLNFELTFTYNEKTEQLFFVAKIDDDDYNIQMSLMDSGHVI
jgi:hypothetical protein